ncbi:peptide/nickel transport system permease protein [Actinacidiphila guanduensis]|uniref:Peptide/nickel transport system permease protein n=1 Tax=Actinacidiphila guanduensis TaxID=310781 RepID=A0A1H0Q0P3_9ACTN|nr:peptide/nickel transport system permease protein [Actinacidiphila guanduensis]
MRAGAAAAVCRYLGIRLGQALIALFGVTTAVFFALRLSGDPAQLLAPQGASQADIAALRHQLGLDAPVWRQYLDYLGNLLHGDLGYSYVQHEPALTLITQRIPYTVNLALAALVLSAVLGVGAGMVMALNRGRWPERVLTPLVLVGQAMPAFWTGILLILVFSVTFNLLPSTGFNGFDSLILPAVTLASLSAATIARMTRGAVLEQLDRDYIRTARSKGAGTARLVTRHLARNISIPILTVLALEVANLLGGSVVTELIFAWPGIGQLTVQSVDGRDFPLIQAIVLLAAVVYIAVNFVTDIAYAVLDPRVTTTGKAAGP